MTFEVPSAGADDTLAAGEALGRLARPGLVVLLQGPLGAGKTVFAKGVARGLGVPGWRYVTSPTFALHNVYEGRLRLHHLDLYRLSGAAELEGLGAEEALYGSGVCVLEWPDLFFEDLPPDRLIVRFRWTGPEGGRSLVFESEGPGSGALGRDLCRALAGPRSSEESA